MILGSIDAHSPLSFTQVFPAVLVLLAGQEALEPQASQDSQDHAEAPEDPEDLDSKVMLNILRDSSRSTLLSVYKRIMQVTESLFLCFMQRSRLGGSVISI